MQQVQKFFYPGEKICNKLPLNIAGSDKILFKNARQAIFKDVEGQYFKNITVLSNGICIKNKIFFSLYSSRINTSVQEKLKTSIKASLAIIKIKKIIRIEYGILITDHYSHNFFHWFGDCLQKIEALKKINYDISNFIFLIPSKCNYLKESLKPYDVKYIVMQETDKFFVKNLLYIPLISPTGNFRPELMKKIRRRLKKYFNQNTELSNKRVYIKRSKNAKRKIINESELFPILIDKGFTIIEMENLSFKQQFDLISECNALIGLHGAGLTHMLWMSENSKILEIRAKDDFSNNCFFSLASNINIKYYYALAKKINKNKTTQKANFYIDVKRFRNTMEVFIN